MGLSQGSVSELLSKPKPWHMLSIKGREPFIRMQLWLNDPTSIEKLQQVKKEKSDIAAANAGNGNGKRKRSYPGGPGSGIGDSGSDRSSPAADTPGDPYSADSPGSHSASSKKQRVYFTDEQKEALKIAFALDPYPSTSSMEFLSQELVLETRSISNWFHNHRMRLKQNLPQGMSDNLALLATGNRDSTGSATVPGSLSSGQSAFDPVKFRLLVHQRMLEMQSPEEAAANSSSVTSLLRQFPSFLQSNPTSPLHASSGLDLSYKRDDDVDSIAESTKSGENNNMDHGDSNSEPTVVTPQAPSSSSSSSRSRRKPAAPQWVRPEWNKAVPDLNSANNSVVAALAAATAAAAAAAAVSASNVNTESPGTGGDRDSNSDSGTINGVCVMNSAFANAETDGATGSDQDIVEKE